MEASLDTCGQRTVQSLLLLLLYLLVVKAAADCPKPQGRENIVLTNEALLMNDFPAGTKVTLECANGYEIESGSEIITCNDGTWTEPELICKRKDCGLPKPQPNMIVNASAGTLFGDVIRVTCEKGYQISGMSYRQCFAAGWHGRSKCNIVMCAKPAEVAKGKSSWDAQENPKYGEIIQYICDEGYTLTGKDSLVCTETGKYDSQPPECKEDRTATESPTQEASTSGDSSTTPPAFTSSATPTASPSVRGGRGILTAEDATTSVTSNTSSSFQGNQGVTVDDNKDYGYTPVIISVIVVSLVVCIVVLIIHKFLLRRKGSYDTREDLKPELLQFQNL